MRNSSIRELEGAWKCVDETAMILSTCTDGLDNNKHMCSGLYKCWYCRSHCTQGIRLGGPSAHFIDRSCDTTVRELPVRYSTHNEGHIVC